MITSKLLLDTLQAIGERQPARRQIDGDWVPPFEMQTDQAEMPEYMSRSLEGPPVGVPDQLSSDFKQLPLRNSMPTGTQSSRTHL